ncbi:MAG: hypothetical protein JST59_07400 [Actinobacteria bacterium]|nr:hypothetical protein [Actinomycetota bacterium]
MNSRGGEALRRLGRGGATLLLAGTLLAVFTLFQWYGSPHSGPNTLLIDFWSYGGGTAWQTLAFVPLLAVLAASVVALAVSLLRLAGSRWSPGIPLGALVSLLGLLAAIAIVLAIGSPPETQTIEDVRIGRVPMEQSVEAGVYLALAASLGVVVGGWLTWRGEGT